MPKILVILIVCIISACAAAPQTHYYNLQAIPSHESSVSLPDKTTLGIGPIKLPSMLIRKGIVTQKNGPAILIASHEIWAGHLKENFTRVMAELFEQNLKLNEVVSEPWETRFRPKYQIHMDVQHFSGELGGEVRFKVNWVLSGNYGQNKLLSHINDIKLNTSEKSYSNYVATLNALMAIFNKASSQIIIKEILKDQDT